ncbi:SLAM family member 5 isoform X2 [Pungitius pungitius]|uniref:SLAM family member 5 isoform X2 n=1 Tax=Pungitius pungitius TaxID=134920 RepID=UPI002E11BD46
MAGGCLSCFLASVSVLLLGGCLHDVEASRCDRVINKKVGDTVELASCAPTEGVTISQWKYGYDLIIEEKTVHGNQQFEGRLDLNPTSFDLTVRQLTRQDSGVFQFVSEVNDKQVDTVTINVTVYEPITKEPDVTVDTVWDAEKNSCTVSLTCSSSSDSSVTYSWSVRNQTLSGSRMDYNVAPQDGDTGFTCTVSNVVSQQSKSITAKCSNDTTNKSESSSYTVAVLGAAGGACLLVVVAVGVAVCVHQRKQGPGGSDGVDNTLYADITDVPNRRGASPTNEPCTVYETIDHKVDPVTPGPQTVYDKIELNRMRKPSVSPYQEVS